MSTNPDQSGLDVQWCREWGTGVRSWAAHGLTRVHRRDPARPDFTLCGVRVEPRQSMHTYPTPDEIANERCQRCARAMETVHAA